MEDDELQDFGRSIMAACNDPQFHQPLGGRARVGKNDGEYEE